MLIRTFKHFKKSLLNNLIEVLNMESCYKLKLLLNFFGFMVYFNSTQKRLHTIYQREREREKRDLLKYKTMI